MNHISIIYSYTGRGLTYFFSLDYNKQKYACIFVVGYKVFGVYSLGCCSFLYGITIFNFLRNFQNGFHSDCTSLYSQQQGMGFSFSPHPHQHLLSFLPSKTLNWTIIFSLKMEQSFTTMSINIPSKFYVIIFNGIRCLFPFFFLYLFLWIPTDQPKKTSCLQC